LIRIPETVISKGAVKHRRRGENAKPAVFQHNVKGENQIDKFSHRKRRWACPATCIRRPHVWVIKFTESCRAGESE